MFALRAFKDWFNNLKVSQKLTLISVFFVMPDSVMLYLFITGINGSIQFARLEQEGNTYQRPLEELLEQIPQHRMLIEEGAPSEVVAAQERQIDESFNSLEKVDGVIGGDLQFTDEGLAKRNRQQFRPRLVRAEWAVLRKTWPELAPSEVAASHLRLVAAVRTMITHAGDLSNLILDPDLDSYYLMDATLLALPQTQDRLAAVTSTGAGMLRQPRVSHADRQELAIFARLLQESDFDRVRSSVQTALNEDPNFYGVSPSLQASVPPVLQTYVRANEEFIALLERIVATENSEVTEAVFRASGKAARDASFALWKIADREVDTLLAARIHDFQMRRARSLMVAAFALLAAVGFVTFITRSISGPLRQQARALQEANESLGAEIAERKRAEEELRLSEAQLATAQKIAGLGSWEWCLKTGNMMWSEEYCRIYGADPQHCQTGYQAALEYVVFADRRASHDALQTALRERKPFSFEQRITRCDGQDRTLHQRGEVILSECGEPLRLVGTAQDVTERKQAEAELERIHKDLMDASRQAGMAEVATGVLHNVGNVLNSVNVSAMLLSDRLGKSRVTHLQNVAGLLRDHAASLVPFLTEDPRGRQLPGFIQSLAERLQAEQTELRDEADSLTRNIGHIKDIVSVQQNYARISGIMEALPPDELVMDAVQMSATALERHEVKVVREFFVVPSVHVDKHKVLQILTNLIRNAKDAMRDPTLPEKRLTLRIALLGSDQVRISIADTGVGIPAENLARIFAFGFTTRSEGHGFGLHSSAIAAKEMGAALGVESAGRGSGATFTLDLPVCAAGESTVAVPMRNAA